jgi:hypothetical protein
VKRESMLSMYGPDVSFVSMSCLCSTKTRGAQCVVFDGWKKCATKVREATETGRVERS